MKLSARNQLTGTVIEVTRGRRRSPTSSSTSTASGSSPSITVEAVDELGLAEGQRRSRRSSRRRT